MVTNSERIYKMVVESRGRSSEDMANELVSVHERCRCGAEFSMTSSDDGYFSSPTVNQEKWKEEHASICDDMAKILAHRAEVEAERTRRSEQVAKEKKDRAAERKAQREAAKASPMQSH